MNCRPLPYQGSALPLSYLGPFDRPSASWWGEKDSNLRRLQPSDLQSDPVDHLGISPNGAGNGTRTRNLLITNQLLYQLSYASAKQTLNITVFARFVNPL
ncbi:uncharacterized protein METZ01_LOCUS376359 [marine metagenome]|uniref:Uncharacterized protein n=1 Tax=marine metagenome TaxID=408172 RepID=A0A382TP13_9ZZZZ